jgi:acyl-CoA synthetase (AMP-forming)/AMP-acid ligase II
MTTVNFYRDLPARVLACADHFRAQGLRAGDRILFAFETSERVLCSFLAMMEIGARHFYISNLPLHSAASTLAEILERVGFGTQQAAGTTQ